MLRTHDNTTLLASVLSVMLMIALTASGLGGGRGPNTLTAFAETKDPAAGREAAEEIPKAQPLPTVQQEPDGDQTPEPKAKRPMRESMARKEQRREEESLKEKKREPKIADGFSATLSREDYEVLLQIVEAEAGICDDRGKILVANVVMNRVKSEEFPDTVREVVYQPSQFSPVSNGTIDSCQVTEETVESVDRALSGEDYSRGALYFMNREASQSGSVRWFDGRLTFLFRHEGHEFFK